MTSPHAARARVSAHEPRAPDLVKTVRPRDHRHMRLPGWVGVGERRWKKSPDEDVQPSKTAWDFLQLLIVPVILVAIALVFNAAQASREQKHQDAQIQEDRALAEAARQDTALDAYYGTMSKLILDRGLVSSKPGSAVREVARTETLALIRRLDSSRKVEVVQFLNEAGLLRVRANPNSTVIGRWTKPVVELWGADLRGADFTQAILVAPNPKDRIDLMGDLRGARFDGADLAYVTFGDFGGADLRGASFNRADILETSFIDDKLQDASFKQAQLTTVSFARTKLTGSAFDKALFASVDGHNGSSFVWACLSGASFAGATFVYGASTLFYGARGHDVDFSDAKGLSKVVFGEGALKRVRFGNARQRPKTVREWEDLKQSAPSCR